MPSPTDTKPAGIAPPSAIVMQQKRAKIIIVNTRDRASVWMKTTLYGTAVKTGVKNAEDEAHLVSWMNEELQGTQMVWGKLGKAIAGAGLVTGTASGLNDLDDLAGGKAKSAAKTCLSKLFGSANTDSASETGEVVDLGSGDLGVDVLSQVDATELMLQFIADALGESLTVVEDAAEAVLDSIPVLGTIFNVAKLAYVTYDQIETVVRAKKQTEQLEGSMSIIEQYALRGVIAYEERNIIDNAITATSSGTKAIASLVGVSGPVTIPFKIAQLTIKIKRLIEEKININKANKALTDGTLDVDHVKKLPTLAISLPNLKSVDALVLMGVMPPGWRKSFGKEKENHIFLQLQKKITAEEKNKWFEESLLSFNPWNQASNNKEVSDIWREDYKRVEDLFKYTNRHLYNAKWMLHKDGEELFLAIPITKGQKITEYLKNKAKLFVGYESGKAGQQGQRAQESKDSLKVEVKQDFQKAANTVEKNAKIVATRVTKLIGFTLGTVKDKVVIRIMEKVRKKHEIFPETFEPERITYFVPAPLSEPAALPDISMNMGLSEITVPPIPASKPITINPGKKSGPRQPMPGGLAIPDAGTTTPAVQPVQKNPDYYAQAVLQDVITDD